MSVSAALYHNDKPLDEILLRYAGRTSVFDGHFRMPPVQKDYEVLRVVVSASQGETPNFGSHQATFKLVP